jgi:hypothetical protein
MESIDVESIDQDLIKAVPTGAKYDTAKDQRH